MLPALAAPAESQFGVFTRRQALGAGYTAEEIRARLNRKAWRQVRRGVYSATKPDPSREHLELCSAACLQVPSRLLSHRSAALLHGMSLVVSSNDVTLTSTENGFKRNGLHVRRGDVGLADRGHIRHLRLTMPARTVVDLAMTESFRNAVVAADSALRLSRADRAELAAALTRFGQAMPIERARRVVDFADGRSESAGESILRVLMADGRLPPPALNVWIGDYRVDLLLEDAGVIVEFDGRVKYTDPDVLWREKLRQEWLANQGYEVVRVTWHDIVARPRETLARIHAAMARGRSRRRAG